MIEVCVIFWCNLWQCLHYRVERVLLCWLRSPPVVFDNNILQPSIIPKYEVEDTISQSRKLLILVLLYLHIAHFILSNCTFQIPFIQSYLSACYLHLQQEGRLVSERWQNFTVLYYPQVCDSYAHPLCHLIVFLDILEFLDWVKLFLDS